MKKPVEKMGLHHFIATGGDPKDYEGMVENGVYEANEKESYETK